MTSLTFCLRFSKNYPIEIPYFPKNPDKRLNEAEQKPHVRSQQVADLNGNQQVAMVVNNGSQQVAMR